MSPSRTNKTRRGGYLLLTVIALIAVASLLLGRVATTSMRVAATAMHEERELRHRWAITSMRQHALNVAPQVFVHRQETSDPLQDDSEPAPTVWKDVELGGQTWRVILADESAKLDVARIALHFGQQKAQSAINEIVTEGSGIRAASDLASIGQVSAGRWDDWLTDRNGTPLTDPVSIAAATRDLTLWGDGRLNIHRCNAESIETLWRILFNRPAPKSLLRDRRSTSNQSASQLVNSLGLRESQARLARQWLSDGAGCYSVWVFCETDRRVPVSFKVEWGNGGSAALRRIYQY